MTPRSTPYALTPFASGLEALAARAAEPAPAAAAQLSLALEARALCESMVADVLAPDWTEEAAWGGQYDGSRLVAAGPGALLEAIFRGGSVVSIALDTGGGAWELQFEPGSTRVRIAEAGGLISECTFPAAGLPAPARDWEARRGSLVSEWKEALEAARRKAAEEAAAAAAAAAAHAEKLWYYAKDDQTAGPVPESELRRVLALLPPDTLVWNPDMDGWKPAAEAGLTAPARFELAGAAGARYPVAGEVRIGRGAGCQVLIQDDLASRVHAIITKHDDGFWVADNHSLNGTYVNEVRLEQPVRLAPGDVIKIGLTALVFQAGGAAAPPAAAPAPATVVAQQAAAESAPAPAPISTLMMQAVCPQCGATPRPGGRFCENCGYKLK